MKTNIKRT